MNWGARDGPIPLGVGWADAWDQIHPTDPGWTYDKKRNPMLLGSFMGARLDR